MEIDQSKVGYALIYLSFMFVGYLFVNHYLVKGNRTLEEAELLASRLNYWGTFIGILSIGSAAGISFGGYNSPTVVLFAGGTPISIGLISLGHNINESVLLQKIRDSKDAK